MKAAISDFKKVLTEHTKKGASLHIRLFAVFISLLFAVVAGVTLLMATAGVFEAKAREIITAFQTELTYLSDEISGDYNNIALCSVELSKKVSKEIEQVLANHNIKPSELASHPEIINTVLNRVFGSLVSGLKYCEGSGVFLVLDATANPDAEGAENSRAGIALRNMEAGTSSLYYDLRYLRGPAAVARKQGIAFLPQWQMEFDISGRDYFQPTVETAQNSSVSLSRLYYWTEKIDIPECSESTMICCVPLIASDGNVMGMIGYDVSAVLFCSRYTPRSSVLYGTFLKLIPEKNSVLFMGNGLYAGKYHLFPTAPDKKVKVHGTGSNALMQFDCGEAGSYKGTLRSVSLYPAGSPYINQRWSVVLMASERDVQILITAKNRIIIILLLVLLGLFAVCSYFLSHYYLRPVKKAFDAIKSDSLSGYSKTRVPEIDDLMQFLVTQDKLTQAKNASREEEPVVIAYNEEKYTIFIENIQTLTPAERVIFDLYLEGLDAQQITRRLHLSINTIKTHNRHIYMKLEVASRKELLMYAKVMSQKAKIPGEEKV